MARKKKQPTDVPPENLDNPDDTFGLPEVEYEPLRRDEPIKPDEPIKSDEPEVVSVDEAPIVTPDPPPAVEEPTFQFKDAEPPTDEPEQDKEKIFEEKHEERDDEHAYTSSYSYQRESPEVWPKVLGFIIILLIAGGAIWYFAYQRPKQLAEEEQERRELVAIQEEARRKEEARLAEAKRLEEQKTVVAQAAVTPKFGEIETLSGRSGRYYVVVASSIDGDLIMDYAKKLREKGIGSKIIPPFGKSKFHRIAVADGDTYETTQATADGLKGGDYGDKIWVVKY
jgi:hypothetical protein